MEIEFDPAKRAATLEARGLDFIAASSVFAGPTFEVDDNRKDYGERRIICVGLLAGRMVVIGYTLRGEMRRIFSMRKANEGEQEKYGHLLRVD